MVHFLKLLTSAVGSYDDDIFRSIRLGIMYAFNTILYPKRTEERYNKWIEMLEYLLSRHIPVLIYFI